MECVHCGKKLSALRKLQDEEFCSAAHRKAYKKKQEELAVDFLRQSKPRRAKPAPIPPPAAPVEPQPILVLADFQQERVGPWFENGTPRRDAQPVSIARHVIVPAGARLPAATPRVPAFAVIALRPQFSAQRPRLAPLTAVRFAVEQPMLRAAAAHPTWIEPAKQSPPERPAANFTRFQPVWVRDQRPPAAAPSAPRFSSIPVLMEREIAPAAIKLQLAASSRPAVTARARSASTQETYAHSWQSHHGPVSMPAATVALRAPCIASGLPLAAAKPDVRRHAGSASPVIRRAWRVSAETLNKPCAPPVSHTLGFTASAWIPAAMPSARNLAPSASTALYPVWRAPSWVLHQPDVALAPRAPAIAVCQAIGGLARRAGACTLAPPAAATRQARASSPEPPLMGSWRFRFATPLLRPGFPVRMKTPPPKSAPMPVGNSRLALVWKIQVRIGRHARVIPLRPRFEDPLIISPHRSVQPEPPANPWKKLAVFWSAVPFWSRRLVAVIILAVLALASFRYLKSSGSVQKASDELKACIRERAAIDIQDDFRAGLSQWTGAPGWADSWTYDATGFARPGRLALLAGSAPLSDYRLEFLAEIDKKAVAWVFRAADTRNYYACKLLESKRGTGAVFSIVRYAMVGGHEHLRIQLPLPLTATAKSMFRVRQEIRGDQFTTYLDGRIIDTWSDASLPTGGFGFFADPGETAYIRWVGVAYQDDTLGRICAYLVPGKHD
ncbi:MAG TPA: hypothetical protein VK335_24045 [Bryobacteraceae bacterium]|nr:hypothetical protein [Bryobacteraceae bacterium]HZW96361.1 hypothetical protein [Candidatus Eremiobacteraceae bacterium]